MGGIPSKLKFFLLYVSVDCYGVRAGINGLPARDRYLIPIAVYAVLNNLILIIDSALTLIFPQRNGDLLFLRSLSAVNVFAIVIYEIM